MKKSLKDRIIAARSKCSLKQREAARLWGFSHSTLQAWENGNRNPAGLYREKLEEVLRQIEES